MPALLALQFVHAPTAWVGRSRSGDQRIRLPSVVERAAGRGLTHAPPSHSLCARGFFLCIMNMYTLTKYGPSLARWGVAAGSVGFFLLYEELPQLILQTQYGNFPGWTGVAREFGLISAPKAAKDED